MKITRVLITCALGDYMRAEVDCIKSIVDADIGKIEVFGTDMQRESYPYVNLDKCITVPKIGDPSYVDKIYQICLEYNIDLLIPTHSSELYIFQQLSKEFESIGTKIMVAGGRIDVASDKILLKNSLESAGIPVPCSATAKTYDELLTFIHGYPEKQFCIKMRDGCGGRGFYLIGNCEYSKDDRNDDRFIPLDSIQKIFDGSTSYLIQEYLPNEEYTVDTLCVEGRIVARATKLNTSIRNGVAENSEIVDCQEALDMCAAIAEHLSLDGNIGFDLKRSVDNSLYVIDVNPRLTATISLVVKAGLDLVHLGMRKALGLSLPKEIPEAHVGVKIHRRLCDVFEKDGELL